MKSMIVLAALAAPEITLAQTVAAVQIQIVEYATNEIRPGVNEIRVDMDTVDLFPTLDRVVKFSPPENTVGDEFICDLDGKRRKYRIVAHTKTNLAMVAQSPSTLPKIGLDWIPLRGKFWWNHVTTNLLTCCIVGEVNEETLRRTNLRVKAPTRNIDIRLVNDKDEIQRILFTKPENGK